MSDVTVKNVVEAALLAAGRPMTVDQLLDLYAEDLRPERAVVREALKELEADYADRGIELKEVASGFRIQIRSTMTESLIRLWQERPPRYSRALMETLALIAYRQPITRGEIEEIRGVSVSTNIMRTLLERLWVRVVGHRDVPGKPAMYATTKQFLDYFGLKKLEDLPPLSDIRDLDSLNVELDFGKPAETEPTADEPDAATDADEFKYAEPIESVGDVRADERPGETREAEPVADPPALHTERVVDS